MSRIPHRTLRNTLQLGLTSLLAGLLLGCQSNPARDASAVQQSVDESLATAQRASPAAPPPEVTEALLPPIQVQLPPAGQRPIEQRFDVAVKNAPAQEFFMSLVAGTPFNMVVHPNVSGEISLSLRDVTIAEVLDTVQDIYGYQYRRDHGMYQVLPARMRSRIYKVDYLNITRKGSSKTLISSGQVTQNAGSGGGNGSGASSGTTPSTATGTGGETADGTVGSQVSTTSDSNFWTDLRTALDILIGTEEGRSIVVNPHAGIVVVRAMPGELRDVEDFLDTIEEAAHRQVLLEAKILEVTLRDSFQSGINWSALVEVGNDKSLLLGQTGGGTILDDGVSALAGTTTPLVRGTQVVGFDTTNLGGMFTIDANLGDFNALIELLQIQGDVHVLSSPRVATVNNQKAVIKVGTDEFFVTDVDTDTDTSTTGTNQAVDVTLTPFFSGVALDVIPQIDDQGDVILHVHPTVSQVEESIKEIATGTTTTLTIPLALSTVRESDTVIRARSGQVVVIGGLMENVVRDRVSKTPLLGDLPMVGNFFRHTSEVNVKSELVILLRPIVVQDNELWASDIRQTADRFRTLQQDGDAGERDDLLKQWRRD